MKRNQRTRAPLYTPMQRRRRDRSVWTRVQAWLAPLQFVACAVSVCLVLRYLYDGHGLGPATASVLVKTAFLYLIMITGSLWEHDVFGKYLFVDAFFWEDAVSFVVIALHTAYVVSLFAHWLTPHALMLLALAAYAAYTVNAAQFLLKLRSARLAAPVAAVAVLPAGASQ